MLHTQFKLVLAAAALLAGCRAGPPRPIEAVTLDTRGVRPEVNYAPLAAVLDRALDADAVPHGEDVAETLDRLDAQLRLLAATGPTATPGLFDTPGRRLAYWYNAAAAWSLKLWAEEGYPETLERDRLEDRPFELDGQQMTLAEIDARLAERFDWRAAIVAPSLRPWRAALPAEPFGPEIADRLQRRFWDYLHDANRFVIDVAAREVRFPPLLWARREWLVERYRRTCGTTPPSLITALIPVTGDGARRRIQDALGYRPTPKRPTDELIGLPPPPREDGNQSFNTSWAR